MVIVDKIAFASWYQCGLLAGAGGRCETVTVPTGTIVSDGHLMGFGFNWFDLSGAIYRWM